MPGELPHLHVLEAQFAEEPRRVVSSAGARASCGGARG